jgi:imidazolonepropionase-like amidohydrolase
VDPLKVFPIFQGIRFEKDINIVNAMLGLQGFTPERSLLDVLPAFTINAAEALFQEDTLGSIETGKKPGLNLFSGMEPGAFRVTPKSNIRVLV